MKKPIRIAIDGPVGSGKGTLAIALAKRLNAFYVNTGAMYRGLALACLRKDVDIKDAEKVLETLNKSAIELKSTRGGTRAFLNGEDVSEEIFKPVVSKSSSEVAVFPKVREAMVISQRKMADEAVRSGQSVVMEGRDITTVVIPDADIKIYLNADIKTRAERRLRQFENRGLKIKFENVLADLKERDRTDTQRTASPLKIIEGATVIDTTNDTVDQTVEKTIEKLKEKNLI